MPKLYLVISRVVAVTLFALLSQTFFLSACGRSDSSSSVPSASKALQDMIQAPARLVWVQDTGPTDRVDVYARGQHLLLMGLDTRDGRGERAILPDPSNYSKPLITPDGQQVVFTRLQDHTIHVVNWDGSGLKQLATGFALAVWQDPQTRRIWVYAATDGNNERHLPPFRRVFRFPLKDPVQAEPVWSQTMVDLDNFQLSADGRLASGVFPWPHCGVAELPNISWKRLGRGCWVSLTPDDSRVFWIFDGAHRNLDLFSLRDDRRWQVNVSQAPGVDGAEVYHPRWSNHPRFMVMTGPHFKVGAKRLGGTESGVYIGRFNPELTTIERWEQATFNERGDFYPDLWIDPAGHDKWSVASVPGPTAGPDPQDIPKFASWPGVESGLVFIWENASKDNQLNDSETGKMHLFRLEPRGQARLGRHFEMDIRNGSFVAEDDVSRYVTQALRTTNEMSLEAVITPAKEDQRGPARIMTISSGRPPRNLLLGQERDRLVLRLRTNEPGQDRPTQLDLAQLRIGEPQHVVLTYKPGTLHVYIDGQLVFAADGMQGGLGNWDDQPLLFGDESGGGRFWNGQLEAVAIYSRALDTEEVLAKHLAVKERLQARNPSQQSVVKARLIQTSALPSPESIAPYRAALVVNSYRVEQVMGGEVAEGDEILVAHWAIMDETVLDTAPRFQDHVYRMTLEFIEDRPELEGERLVMDTEDLLLPLFVDVNS